jgi:hypothetical protein
MDALNPDPSNASLGTGTGDPGIDADYLLEQARTAESQETAAIATAPTEETYNAQLQAVIEEKVEQANEIEGRLEGMMEQQNARLTQMQQQSPGMLSLPGKRQAWQANIARAQATMQRIAVRLEMVREIRDGMSVHGPRVEAIAAAKLDYREPKLADDFEELMQARRLHELHTRAEREKEQYKEKAIERGADDRKAGRALARGLAKDAG